MEIGTAVVVLYYRDVNFKFKVGRGGRLTRTRGERLVATRDQASGYSGESVCEEWLGKAVAYQMKSAGCALG